MNDACRKALFCLDFSINFSRAIRKTVSLYAIFLIFIKFAPEKGLYMRKTTTPSRYRQDLKERIVKVAMDQFKSRGVRNVKMDDIAGALSISKRTLYEVFPNKEELLIWGVRLDEERRKQMMKSFVEENNPGVMDVILKFYHAQMEAIFSESVTEPSSASFTSLSHQIFRILTDVPMAQSAYVSCRCDCLRMSPPKAR